MRLEGKVGLVVKGLDHHPKEPEPHPAGSRENLSTPPRPPHQNKAQAASLGGQTIATRFLLFPPAHSICQLPHMALGT